VSAGDTNDNQISPGGDGHSLVARMTTGFREHWECSLLVIRDVSVTAEPATLSVFWLEVLTAINEDCF
jgi:hypothetical protein